MKAATPAGVHNGGGSHTGAPAGPLPFQGHLIAVTREERIHLTMRRCGMTQTRMGVILRRRGVRGGGPQIVCEALRRRVNIALASDPKERGRYAKTQALLAEMEDVLGLEER